MTLAASVTANRDSGPERPAIRTDSVVKGSLVLSASRILGMGTGFLLFLLVAWRSREDAGIFRTAVTYLTISEFLPLLGMHRWLATEMAAQAQRRRAVFRVALRLAVGVSAAMALLYLIVALTGIYSAPVSHSLLLVSAAVVGSGLNLCSASALVGMGLTHRLGMLNLYETLARSLIGIVLVASGQDIITVIAVYAVARWVAALIGLHMVTSLTQGTDPDVSPALKREFRRQLPNLATGVICTIVIRYSAMVLLPWLRNEGEAALFAAPYQLFDLLMLGPTMLIYSSNFVFCEAALKSAAALRQSTHQLIYLSSLYVFPLAALAIVLAQPIVVFFFKLPFAGAAQPFQLLMLAAPVAALDQALSQTMVTAGNYRHDVVSTSAGAGIGVLATLLMASAWGASGAAAAFLLGTSAAVVVRLGLLRGLLDTAVLMRFGHRQLLAAILAAVAIALLNSHVGLDRFGRSPLWLAFASAGLFIYGLLLQRLGVLSRARVGRLRHFLSRRS